MDDYDWSTLPVRTIVLGNDEVTLRPLAARDECALGDYFLGLSEATRRVYSPHAFDRLTASAICRELDTPEGRASLRLVATTAAGGIVGYFIVLMFLRPWDRTRCYSALNPDLACTLAPSTADAWQNKGLGSKLMAYAMDCARVFGKKTMVLWGGVRAENARAVHFYIKFGFRKCGEFLVTATEQGKPVEINNFDMAAEL